MRCQLKLLNFFVCVHCPTLNRQRKICHRAYTYLLLCRIINYLRIRLQGYCPLKWGSIVLKYFRYVWQRLAFNQCRICLHHELYRCARSSSIDASNERGSSQLFIFQWQHQQASASPLIDRASQQYCGNKEGRKSFKRVVSWWMPWSESRSCRLRNISILCHWLTHVSLVSNGRLWMRARSNH